MQVFKDIFLESNLEPIGKPNVARGKTDWKIVQQGSHDTHTHTHALFDVHTGCAREKKDNSLVSPTQEAHTLFSYTQIHAHSLYHTHTHEQSRKMSLTAINYVTTQQYSLQYLFFHNDHFLFICPRYTDTREHYIAKYSININLPEAYIPQ